MGTRPAGRLPSHLKVNDPKTQVSDLRKTHRFSNISDTYTATWALLRRAPALRVNAQANDFGLFSWRESREQFHILLVIRVQDIGAGAIGDLTEYMRRHVGILEHRPCREIAAVRVARFGEICPI